MLDNIGGVTSQYVSLALDAAVMRHQMLANNIANVNTENFQTQQMEFESQLNALMASNKSSNESENMQRISAFKEQLHDGAFVSENNTGDKPKLDQELVKLTENVLHYRALLEGLGKRGSIIKLAITEGK